MNSGIQIPTFSDAPISKGEVIPSAAPAAPAQPAPASSPKQGEGVPAPDQSDFLKSVRESNEKKAAKPNTSPNDAPPDPKTEKTPEAVASSRVEAEESDDDSDNDTSDPELPRKTKATSIKDLKLSLNSERSRAETLENRIKELETEVSRYADVDTQLEELQRLRERNAHLESLEQILDIQSNPEFQSKYVDGVNQIVAEAQQIASDYKGDPNIIAHALKLTNRKDLTDFLHTNFKGDQYAVQEVRPYILKAQELIAERTKLEKSPEEAREQLSNMVRENQAKRLEESTKRLKLSREDAWTKITAYYTRGPNAIEAFKEKPGDAEHNTRRDEILGRANVEFSKAIGVLARLGTTEMPEGLAQTLAARFQLSELAGHYEHEVKRLNRELAEVTKKLEQANGITRPQFSNAGGTSVDRGEGPKTTSEIATHVFENARQKVLSGQV